MTRSEAKREYYNIIENGMITFNEKGLIDNIYDDFESRICENCEYYHNEVCVNDESPLCTEFGSSVYGCNKFQWLKTDKKAK